MKRCPECRRDYYDDSLLYCLDDGTALLEGPASGEEPVTAVMTSGAFRRPSQPSGSDSGRRAYPRSIAVLPFANMSADPDNEYFCDGLAEELLNALAKVEELKVAARTSSFSFKGKAIDIAEIAERLGVSSVLEGSVRKLGNRLRITAQLINAADGYHIWSERYDRELEDIFDVQDEITLSIVQALKLKLLGGEREAVLRRHTVDTEAYELYLRGRYLWNKRTPESIREALENFKASADKDPGYALAWVGIADTYALFEQYTGDPSSSTAQDAEDAALRALALDESLAEAHASMGMINMKSWDWAASEASFRRSIDLNANYPTAHHWYSMLLRALGRNDEMLSEISRAHDLDPLSYVINANMAISFLILGDPDRVEEICRKMIELDPSYGDAYHYLSLGYTEEGRNKEATEAIDKAAALKGRSSEILASMGYVYALAGKQDEARSLVAELEENYRNKRAAGQNLAAVYSGLGDHDKAFEWLERDFEDRSGILPFVRWFQPFKPLRDDKRLEALLRRMNLPIDTRGSI